jgi:hypothetical protein
MYSGAVIKKAATFLLIALSLGGCATTYVPISWNFGEQVQSLSRTDPVLAILFNRYDPGRETLRVSGASFDEVMMPSEVKYHLGAYRRDTKLIYRSLYQAYSDHDLRDLMAHEFAHHIWFGFMSPQLREKWVNYLADNPAPVQRTVRGTYAPPEYDSEDFAFVVEYARPVDILELARLEIISSEECEKLLSGNALVRPRILQGSARAAPGDAARSQDAPTTMHQLPLTKGTTPEP